MIFKKDFYKKLQNNSFSKSVHIVLMCLGVLLFLFPQFIHAQKVTATADRDKIVLGEQIVVTLKVENVGKAQSIAQWFEYGKTTHSEVVNKSKIDTVNFDNTTTYIQKWNITSFDSGHWTLPIQSIKIQDNGSVHEIPFSSDSLQLDVLTVDVSKMKDYHDIKDVIGVNYKDYTWVIIGLVAIVLVTLLFFLIRYIIRKRKQKKANQPKSVIKGAPIEWAQKEIQKLQGENPANMLFYTRLDNIIRTYLDEVKGWSTLHATTDEAMVKIKGTVPDAETVTTFFQTWRMMDFVKFAKYKPEESLKKSSADTALAFVKYFQEHSQNTIK